MKALDNLITSFDFDKFKSNCIVHDFMKAYLKKKSNLSLCEDNEADRLRIQLKDYSDILERLLTSATRFPAGCENCVGMKKCVGCINQDILAEAFTKLQKYL
jgi:hypothetical protein